MSTYAEDVVSESMADRKAPLNLSHSELSVLSLATELGVPSTWPQENGSGAWPRMIASSLLESIWQIGPGPLSAAGKLNLSSVDFFVMDLTGTRQAAVPTANISVNVGSSSNLTYAKL